MRIRLLSSSLWAVLAVTATPSPALPEKPPRWEYAELTYNRNAGRAASQDRDGNKVPAVPASESVSWTAAAGAVEVEGWAELAEKLKVAGFKSGRFTSAAKIQILNALGRDGWELVDQRTLGSASGFTSRSGFGSSTMTWLFKRPVP